MDEGSPLAAPPIEEARPYGVLDLVSAVRVLPGLPLRVQCFVRGCSQILRPSNRCHPGDVCPIHGIRCHLSRTGPTYSFDDPTRNLVISQGPFADRLFHHPFKFDSRWLGYEKSEDALTFNVFRSLQVARSLRKVVQRWTGLDNRDEPHLFLWGLGLNDDNLRPWDLLIAARQQFESNLPVRRPCTEPDLGLLLPGQYLILVECKFTSSNPTLEDGPRRNARSLTKDEFLATYADPALSFLDVSLAHNASVVHEQLWRNVVFAEWMAGAAGVGTQAYCVNLTRADHETASCERFRLLLHPQYADRFIHSSWEDLYHAVVVQHGALARLGEYLATKSAGLRPAFQIDSPSLPTASS